MPFRDAQHACPACGTTVRLGAPLVRCSGCRGVWISEAGLTERLRAMRGPLAPALDPGFVPSSHRDGDRRCPGCREPLAPVRLEAVDLERCENKHGLWFDLSELPAVLLAAAPVKDDRLAPHDAIEAGGWVLAAIAGLLGAD
jgi:Zn-finger nucleic acid-binding protein